MLKLINTYQIKIKSVTASLKIEFMSCITYINIG